MREDQQQRYGHGDVEEEEDPASRPSGQEDAEEGELVGEIVTNNEYNSSDDLPPRKRAREDRHTGRSEAPGTKGIGSSRRPHRGDSHVGALGEESEDDSEYMRRVEAALQVQQEDDDAVIEARRRRRREILAKYERRVDDNAGPEEHHHDVDMLPPTERKDEQQEEEVKEKEEHAMDTENANGLNHRDNGIRIIAGESDNNDIDVAPVIGQQDKKTDNNVSSDDVDDIFADTPLDETTKHDGVSQKPAASKGLVDSYDDAEGYYNFQVGEIIRSRYEVFATHGRGVFSSVLRARDVKHLEQGMSKDACPQVAVKVIRANDTMYKAGQTERVILNKLSQADPDGKKHCIRLLDSFDYRNHLCLVFEPMAMNLRDLTKKYGRGIGLSINAVRIYATQMLIALQHLKHCGVLHADIKPDNILVNDKRTVIKICDFGSAMFSGDNEITPYLVSRFYRSPEVILGLPYDHPMDMWSIGCVMYELFTGQILFKGRSNNEMLKYIMDVKGPFPKKMLKKAEFAFKHFDMTDATMAFAMEEPDPVTHQIVKRMIPNPQKQAGFSKLLAHQSDNKKKVNQLADLLERMFALEPEKRITPLDALQHPFIKEQTISNPYMAQAPRAIRHTT